MDNLTWDSPINKTNDFYWYGISLICISIPILLEIFDRYKKEKKNMIMFIVIHMKLIER